MGGAGSKRTEKRGPGRGTFCRVLFYAFSGLMWVAPRTPSLRPGLCSRISSPPVGSCCDSQGSIALPVPWERAARQSRRPTPRSRCCATTSSC